MEFRIDMFIRFGMKHYFQRKYLVYWFEGGDETVLNSPVILPTHHTTIQEQLSSIL